MTFSKNRIFAIAIVFCLIFSMAASIMLLPNANAHYPPLQVPTFSFCSVSPNPIGAGQTARVNFWVGEPPPTASGQFGDRWGNLTVVVTKPDETTTDFRSIYIRRYWRHIHNIHACSSWKLHFPNVLWRTNISRQ